MTKRCFIFIEDDGGILLTCDETHGTEHRRACERIDSIIPKEQVKALQAAIERLSTVASSLSL